MHTPEHSTALPRESSAALIPANKAAGGGGGLFRSPDMSTCPHCGHQHASVDQRLRSLFAARVGMAAKVNRRSDAASHNELATAIQAAEDVVDPRSAAPESPLPAPGVCFWVSVDGLHTRTMRGDGCVLLESWTEQWDEGYETPRMSLDGRNVEELHPDAIRSYAAEYAARKDAKVTPERFDADWDGGVK